MIIGVDKNQLIGKHGASNQRKHAQMVREGAILLPLRIPFGDYILIDDEVQKAIDRAGGADAVHKKDLLDAISLSIDTKKNLQEVVGNICSKQHERFKRELIASRGRLILLIEEYGIECLEDVWWWENPRAKYSPRAPKGTALYRSLCTIRDEYGVDIRFCDRKIAGKEIIKILGGNIQS
jgi:ribosome-associated protein